MTTNYMRGYCNTARRGTPRVLEVTVRISDSKIGKLEDGGKEPAKGTGRFSKRGAERQKSESK